MNLFDPSTFEGGLTIGVLAGVISGIILGFFSGKAYEKKKIYKSNIQQKGDGNTAIQNSKVGRDVNAEKK